MNGDKSFAAIESTKLNYAGNCHSLRSTLSKASASKRKIKRKIGNLLLEGREVGVPDSAPRRVPCRIVGGLSKWPSVSKTRREVGVVDKRPPEGNQIRVPTSNGLLCSGLSVAAIANDRGFEHLARFGERERLTKLVEAEAKTIHDVSIGEIFLAQLFQSVRKELVEVGRTHIVVHAIGGETHTNLARWRNRQDCINNLLQEAKPILNRASILVSSLVACRLKKLIDQVAIGSMNLDTIKSGSEGTRGGPGIVLDDTRDLAVSSARGTS
jgi:hypothetical protein